MTQKEHTKNMCGRSSGDSLWGLCDVTGLCVFWLATIGRESLCVVARVGLVLVLDGRVCGLRVLSAAPRAPDGVRSGPINQCGYIVRGVDRSSVDVCSACVRRVLVQIVDPRGRPDYTSVNLLHYRYTTTTTSGGSGVLRHPYGC